MLTPDEIKRRLHETQSIDFLDLITAVSWQAEHQSIPIYLVGGFVRDLILNRPNKDLDFAVEGDSIALASALSERFGGDICTYPEFGTATWTRDYPDLDIDFAMTRRETYDHPGALPTVSRSTLQDDLRRRDFTINAMAIRLPNYEVIDRFGGLADLENGVIRVLHDQSFIDDPTRIFRAVRFEQRYGFTIEPHTESLLRDSLPALDQVSSYRINHELKLIFKEHEKCPDVLQRLSDLNVLAYLYDGLRVTEPLYWAFRSLSHLYTEYKYISHEAYWLVLFNQIENPTVFARLEWEQLAEFVQNLRALLAAVAVLADAEQQPASEVARSIESIKMKKEIHESMLEAAMALHNWNPRHMTLLKNYRNRWRHIHPKLNGRDLQAMGLHPGPTIGRILRQLRDALIDGQIISTRDQERALVQSWIDNGTFN